MRFTKAAIGSLALPEGKREWIVWDEELPGFGVRVRSNSKAWRIQYRAHGKQHSESLGDIRKVSLEDARKIAKKRFAAIELGIDPSAEKAKARLTVNTALTLGAVVTRYLEAKRNMLRPATLSAATLHLTNHWKPFAHRPLAAITRADVAAQLQTLTKERGKVAAARARTNLSALYAWSIAEGLADVNVVDGTNRPDEGVASRSRVLNEQELVGVWNACGDDDGGRVIKLLILLGCRKTEIGSLLWREVDLDKGVLAVSGSRTKNHHTLTLAPPSVALELLRATPRGGGEHVFGRHGFVSWSDLKAELDTRSGVSGWTLHDLRRSTATHMADIGIQPHVIEEILNHRSGHKGGIAGIYNRSSYERETKIALALWATRLVALAEGRNPTVVQLPRPSMAAEGGGHG
jgi:integrase